jgi:CspA family cold shock protein
MNFRDQALTCAVCGKTFIYTVTEQRQLYEAGKGVRESSLAPSAGMDESDTIAPPTKCPDCRLQDPETGRWSGRIKWFSYEKGYGFIVKSNADEIFFHRSQVVDEPLTNLAEGTPVTFQEATTDRGAEARQVRVESQ